MKEPKPDYANDSVVASVMRKLEERRKDVEAALEKQRKASHALLVASNEVVRKQRLLAYYMKKQGVRYGERVGQIRFIKWRNNFAAATRRFTQRIQKEGLI